MLQKAERLQATLHLIGQAQPQQKTLFEDEGSIPRRVPTVAVLDAHAVDNAHDMHGNVLEDSAAVGVDDATAARVSRYGGSSSAKNAT